jgi:pyruvate dehydrogenase E2 component (dihydrolipoamide acetyltransferase)
MAIDIKMPQLSDTMNAGKILSWNKKEGDVVKRGDVLAEVETEKANLEIEAFHQGTLLKILVPAESSATVGEVIAIIGEPNETAAGATSVVAPAATLSSSPAPTSTQSAAPTPSPAVSAATAHEPTATSSASSSDRVKASPLARKLAEQHHIDLHGITGSGPAGRIVSKDLGVSASAPAATPAPTPAPAPQPVATPAPTPAPAPTKPAAPTAVGGGTLTPLSKMRETIARRMQDTVTQSPHFFTTATIDMDDAVSLRETLKARPEFKGISINHLVIKATAFALAREPRVNAAMRDGMLFQPNDINIGIITAIDDGLLIPVVRCADQLSLADIVFEARAAVDRARAGRPSPTDLVGGTFSISNMGMYDIESFTALINPGQGAVLAVSSTREDAIVKNGTITIGKRMRVTLSVDHRIIDGVMAGTWLKHFKEALETPALLLLP